MANNENWVNDRLNALAPPAGWKPDPARALAQLRERDLIHRRRTRWAWSGGMAAGLLCLGIFLTPARCAFGVCRTPTAVEREPVAVDTPAQIPAQAPIAVPASGPRAAAPARAAAKPAPADTPAPSAPVNYKESGSPAAPIVCELYTDYQCPHCATAYDQIIPMLRAEYVQTGKVRFVHRDFPLPSHQYARLAARYANAAGTLGQYELVVTQIFRTQPIWAQSGDVDSQVALVLTPSLMDQVRALVHSDAHLDDTVFTDVAAGRQDNLNQTPTLVVSYKGTRQLLAPIPPYSLLKSYLDELLTK